jgi:hypothetical protein
MEPYCFAWFFSPVLMGLAIVFPREMSLPKIEAMTKCAPG